ncbi:MAG: hypothetical protein ACR2G5_16650 [Pyrinomonadaceae bacterium]
MLYNVLTCGKRLSLTLCVFCIALFFTIFSPSSITQSSAVEMDTGQEAPQTNDRFSTALESQLVCKNTPEPARAIGALQKTGIIERRSYLNFDSVSYFRVRQPLNVWGFKVVSVFGFDFHPRIFERGPGTAPPITLGVVVPVSERNVKDKLSSLGLENIAIGRAAELDMDSKRAKSTVLTEISCTER